MRIIVTKDIPKCEIFPEIKKGSIFKVVWERDKKVAIEIPNVINNMILQDDEYELYGDIFELPNGYLINTMDCSLSNSNKCVLKGCCFTAILNPNEKEKWHEMYDETIEDSKYGKKLYVCGYGDTPMEALENLKKNCMKG